MNKLKEIRMKNNISQELLACKVGVTVRYIAFLESGARKPSIDVAFKIAKVLKSTVDDIFLPRKCTKMFINVNKKERNNVRTNDSISTSCYWKNY